MFFQWLTKNREKEDRSRAEFQKEALAYLDDMYRLAYYLTRHVHEAEDLVQESFIKALRFRKKFKKGNLKAWLLTIVRNTFINTYRRKKRQQTEVQEEKDLEFSLYHALRQAQNEQHQVDEILEACKDPSKMEQVFGDEIINALNSLNEEFREVIVLCDVEGLSYQEIAQILGVPIGTVRSRLARARSSLEKKLWDYACKKGILKRGEQKT